MFFTSKSNSKTVHITVTPTIPNFFFFLPNILDDEIEQMCIFHWVSYSYFWGDAVLIVIPWMYGFVNIIKNTGWNSIFESAQLLFTFLKTPDGTVTRGSFLLLVVPSSSK